MNASSCANQSFYDITVYFIDNESTYQSVVLDMGEDIANIFMNV